jgi:hypothetical protein
LAGAGCVRHGLEKACPRDRARLTAVEAAAGPAPPIWVALDLADLHYVDAVGMRELRGQPGERSITIVAASEAVRRLSELMGWDTDPGVGW